MEAGDALVDIGAFMGALSTDFPAAAAVRSAAEAAVIHHVTADGTPWFTPDPVPAWTLAGNDAVGLSLYADLQGLGAANNRTLSWHSRFYTKTVSSENPTPYSFITGPTTWADVFYRYWAESSAGVSLQTPEVCFPDYPEGEGIIELEARGGMNDIEISWQVVNPLGDTLDHYALYKFELGVGATVIASQINAHYSDQSNLVVGNDYCYYVAAMDSNNSVIETSNTACTRFGELQLVMPHQNIPPNSVNVPVPVSVVNGNGLCIGAADISITYNPAIVTAVGVNPTAYTAGYAFNFTVSEPGKVSISALTTSCQPLSGAGALFEVVFDVIGVEGAVTPAQFIYGLEGTTIYDASDLFNPVLLRLIDGSLRVAVDFIRGDINGDGAVNSADSLLALHIAAGIHTPTTQQAAACDVNGDGGCNSADSTLILCYATHDDWAACGLPNTARRARQSAHTIVSLASVINGRIPVILNASPGIAGGTLTFTYDPDSLTVEGIDTTGTALEGVTVITDSAAGLLRVAFADTEAIAVNDTLLYLDVVQLVDSATVQLAGTQFNDVAGLDWERNLGRDIVPTALTLQHQSTTSPIPSIIWIVALMFLVFTTLFVKRTNH